MSTISTNEGHADPLSSALGTRKTRTNYVTAILDKHQEKNKARNTASCLCQVSHAVKVFVRIKFNGLIKYPWITGKLYL